MSPRRRFRLRTRTIDRRAEYTPPAPSRGRERGTLIWAEDGSESERLTAATASAARDVEEEIALDPEVEQHLDFALHHPGFIVAIEELHARKGRPRDLTLAKIAHRYRVSL